MMMDLNCSPGTIVSNISRRETGLYQDDGLYNKVHGVHVLLNGFDNSELITYPDIQGSNICTQHKRTVVKLLPLHCKVNLKRI